MVKLKPFLAFFRLGDLILVVALVVSIGLLFQINDPQIKSYVTNVSASFLFAGIIRGVELYREFFRQISFIRFFGYRIARNDFYVVYPEFGLDPRLYHLAKEDGLANQRLFIKNNIRNNADDIFRIDLESCAASNDLRAMVEMSSLFAKLIHEPTKVAPDKDWDRIQEDSFVSIGFSSNYVTHKWLRLAANHLTVVPEETNKRYGEHVELNIVRDDVVDKAKFVSTENDGEVGLVIKFRPDADRPDIIWFICAGIGGDATVGSAVFLARKWPKLLDMFGEDDFILVLRTAPGVAVHAQPIFAVQNRSVVQIESLK